MNDPTQERIRALVEGAATVARQVDLAALLESTVATAMDLTGARYGAVGVLGDNGELAQFVHAGMSAAEADGIGHVPLGEGVLGTITRERKTLRLDDVSAHPDSVGFPENHPPMTTFLGVPVRVGQRGFGNLYLTDKPGGFTDQDEVLVELLAIAAGTAVSTLRMQEQLRRVALQADRERIALDLHDSIIQDLFAVGLSLQASAAQVKTAPDAVRNRLEEAVDRLDDTIRSLRRFIFDLHPPVWVQPGYGEALEDLVESIAEPYGRLVHLDIDCDSDELPTDVAENVNAVVKEAVSNALRHAGAERIAVHVGCDDDNVFVRIEDDGVGFDTGATHNGMGLGNIARRLEAIGGRHQITSTPGVGTRIEVSLSIRQ